ncbi:MAG: CCA tRNA nucleotidyltransferase [Planctomycetaceae bacterium]|nr:CCA tRNA nucleotidyltransferase [Planctomycetaceae bacterium]
MSNRDAAYSVVKRLRLEGFVALFAGGCVRDRLLGRPASDYDVATDARPEQVIALFRRTLKIGAQFGVVMVLLDSVQVEVATFRTEGGYQDGRHPAHVEFASAREDAARRDFTVNGMFYDPLEKQVLDFVGGREDLEKKVLRTIGEPDERFAEDYLRLLRAIRFAVKLDFSIDAAAWASIQRHAEKITLISAERIAMELEEILTHPGRAAGARLLIDSGLAKAIFEDFAGDKAEFAVKLLAELPPAVDFGLALASLWSGFETARAMEECEELKLSLARLKQIRFLLEKRSVLLDAQMPISRLKLLMHEPYFADLLILQEAIQNASGLSAGAVKTIRRRALELDPQEVHPKPLLDGHELIALGAVPGPMVGHLARELYIAQLEGSLKTPEQARAWVQLWLSARAGEE